VSKKESVPVVPTAKGGSSAAKKRIAQQRAAQAAAAKAKERRRKVIVVVSVTIIVAIVAAGVLTIAGLTGGKNAASASSPALPAQVVNDVANVPQSALDQVGAGTVAAVPATLSGPALTSGGKPQILYVGAEYCPYCAAERWPMAVALSRFGTLSNLGATASSSTDVYPSTQTLSFHGATYKSGSIDFVGKEIENTQEQPLDKLNSSEEATFDKYDAPPYVPASGKGAIPFVDIGGRYLISGVEYDPQLLQGKSRTQIASALSDPSSSIAQAVDGTANVITAAICKVDANAPAKVCTSAGVVAAAKKLT
jgi:hypothetical protein